MQFKKDEAKAEVPKLAKPEPNRERITAEYAEYAETQNGKQLAVKIASNLRAILEGRSEVLTWRSQNQT
jgi:hypothetical protein